ncbi:interleukin-17 receptor C isoform X8 [Ailuropoda melanoleuca]|uniref:interleukin-17 receptor C isoform X8 n=1 Tax=Ailuropoda melanoleuca TaxID=9646 RepID=UPI0014945723|nr:interleukin-17 receptor C isoform X8 [Ailuropoda melanoleuca]
MPVPWFLLSLALGRSPMVLSLEKLMGPQDTARCSPMATCCACLGASCLPQALCWCPHACRQSWCLGATRRPTVTSVCVWPSTWLCTGTGKSLKMRTSLEEQLIQSLRSLRTPFSRPKWCSPSRPTPLPAAFCWRCKCPLPSCSLGSVVFDCFEAALGAEVRLWSYTQPRYQKELNLTQQLPALPWLGVSADGDDVHLVLDVSEEQHFGLSLYWNQIQGPTKPWWHKNLTGPQNITLNHTDLFPCLCIQDSYSFFMAPFKCHLLLEALPYSSNCLFILLWKVWPLEPDSVRTSICPFREDPRAHRNLWRAARLRLLPPQGWQLNAPCSLLAEATLCWQAPGGGPCQSLVPPLSWANVTVNKTLELPLLNAHPNLCVQQVSSWEKLQLQQCLWADSLGALKDDMLLVETRGPQDNRSLCALEPSGCTPLFSRASTRAARLGEGLLQDLQSGQCLQLWEDDLRALWACPMDKYVHQRWALVWLACLLLASVLFLLFLFKKDHVKGWLRLLKEDLRAGAAARARAALLLYSAEDSGFERLVGALASALCQLPLRVAVDLWSRRELSAQGPLAWFHAQRRQTLQEGGVVVLLFSPGAVALCHEWLQDGASASAPHGPHDAFAASLSCVLPDFLQGRAPGRYVGAYFDGLLHSEAVPTLFRSVPVFSLPSQLPDFLGTLQGPAAPRPGRLGERAKQVSRALQPALDQVLKAPRDPGGPGDGTRDGT